MLEQLKEKGYTLVPAVLSHESIHRLARTLLAQLGPSVTAGTRHLAGKAACIAALARSAAIRALIEPILGAKARLVRSILFTKTMDTNWPVAWHQDLSIAVRAQAELADYGPWSTKDGVAHVQPPITVLEHMLTLRLHLDATDADNGALWVAPGSHRLGRIPISRAATVAQQYGPQLCAAQAGDVLLLRPLLLHSSHKSRSPQARRVIHLEFAASALPAPLAWHEDVH